MSRTLLASFLLTALLGGCRTAEVSGGGDHLIPQGYLQQVRMIEADGREVGSLVEYRLTGPGGGTAQVVRNLYAQDLGLIDSSGRAHKYRAHTAPLALARTNLLETLRVILGLPWGVEIAVLDPKDPAH